MKQENSTSSFLSILVISIISFSTFWIFLLALEFKDNYKIIKHQNEFKKIKVKIDSSKTTTSRTGKGSASFSSTSFYFNNGSILNNESHKQEIIEYMTDHHDSLYVWSLDKETSKFAYEGQKEINTTEEVESNNKKIVPFIIYTSFLLLFLFRNKLPFL